MRSPGPTPGERTLIDACFASGVPFLWRGPGSLLIAQTGVIEVTRSLTAAGLVVLGFEGFELDGAAIHPRIDLIFDTARRPNADALTVLAGWPPDVWIDVTVRVPTAPER